MNTRSIVRSTALATTLVLGIARAEALTVAVPSVGPPCNSPVVDTGLDVTAGDHIRIDASGTISLQDAEHAPPDPMAIVNNPSGTALLDSTGWNFGCNGTFALIAAGQANPSLDSIFAAGGCSCGDEPVPSLSAPLGALLWGEFVAGQTRLDHAAAVFAPTAGSGTLSQEVVVGFSGRLGLQINDHYAPNNSGELDVVVSGLDGETPTVPPDPAATATPTATPTSTATEVELPAETPTEGPTAEPTATEGEEPTATPAVEKVSLRVERVTLRRGRLTRSGSEPRFALRAVVADERTNGQSTARDILNGGFQLEVSDGDASFDVVLPLAECARSRTGGVLCRDDTKGRVRVALTPTSSKGRWLLRADTAGLDPDSPEVRIGPETLEAPVLVVLRGGSAEWSDEVTECRPADANALVCQVGRARR